MPTRAPAPASPPDRDTYRVQEVADRMGVSDDTVRRWIKSGRLRAFKLPGGNITLIRHDALTRFQTKHDGNARAR